VDVFSECRVKAIKAADRVSLGLTLCSCTQDEEVEVLERAAKPGGYLGLSRAEVMGGMYGRMDPSPAGAQAWAAAATAGAQAQHQ
jgi:hypothetical protein